MLERRLKEALENFNGVDGDKISNDKEFKGSQLQENLLISVSCFHALK